MLGQPAEQPPIALRAVGERSARRARRRARRSARRRGCACERRCRRTPMTSWLGVRVEAGPASDASVSMQPHRREFSYQVSFAGPPATRRPTNRTQVKAAPAEPVRTHQTHILLTCLLPESDHRARGASPPNRTAPRTLRHRPCRWCGAGRGGCGGGGCRARGRRARGRSSGRPAPLSVITRSTLMPWRRRRRPRGAGSATAVAALLVGEHLDVGQPGGVVDADVHELPADVAPRAPAVGVGAALAGRGWPVTRCPAPRA